MKQRGRHIAFDYGDARIGVAITDPDQLLATPLPFIPYKARRTRLEAIFEEYQPIHIYLGRPLHLSGQESSTLLKVEEFAAELAKYQVPISYIDERMTTASAAKKLRQAGVNSKDQRELIDSMAAVEILEAGLAL